MAITLSKARLIYLLEKLEMEEVVKGDKLGICTLCEDFHPIPQQCACDNDE